MYGFDNITPLNGFDFGNLNNARQNNYAWSVSELGDYIYIGTGRNVPLGIIKSLQPEAKIPVMIRPEPVDNQAEIWRKEKDSELPWERVYKAPADSGITGFRFMIADRPLGGTPCIFAATYGKSVRVLKSTNGVNWFILPDNILKGTSSRAMVIKNKKVYIATVDDANKSALPWLYSSDDPEFYPWKLVIDSRVPGFNTDKNPKGAISNMEVFNGRIYVATSNADGAQVWRTNGAEPKLNDWKCVVDKGFGNPDNKYTLSIGTFKDYLYVSGTKKLPESWVIPQGCDIIRIDKHDNWQLVVGGHPFLPWSSSEDKKCESLSGLGSGFNNPFNVYAWQIKEYYGKLFISTFDDSSNMEVILDLILANRIAIERLIGEEITELIIGIFKAVVKILYEIKYPLGFDLYVSEDGIHFRTLFLNGFHNANNYGGRLLYVDNRNELYLGTANPFQGCEVWKINDIDYGSLHICDELHYEPLWEVREVIEKNYKVLNENMPAILEVIRKRV